MTKLINLNKNDDKVRYSDGVSIEDKMLNYAKNKKVIFEENEKWPVIYHFSKYREGVLSWYPFKKNCTILEIGSGCGAITNLLCKKAKRVVSVELEYNRALINYERNLNVDNLDIIVGNINYLKLKEKFDYVIINGVLEYAQYILDNKNDDAYISFLKKSKTFLKKDGIMLLAIENRLGLKYFVGRKEDHLANIYSGVNGYKNSNIKTFSKQELDIILKKSGYKINKWYYPYPDYKFPFEIFTDKSINKIYPSTLPLPLDFNQIEFIDSENLYRSFMKNKIMEYFSNSFLVEANNINSNDIDYVKLSSIRKDIFSIYTYIDYSKGFVYKKNIYESGLNHIKNLCKNNYHNKMLSTIDYKFTGNYTKCKLIKGETLLDKTLDNHSDLVPVLKKIYESLIVSKPTIKKSNKEFIKVFGNIQFDVPLHWIKGVNIDLLLNNIYFSNNKYLIIDPEWQFDFCIPAEYIIWRILFNLPQNGICDRNMIKHTIKSLDINPNLCGSFKKMEMNFVFNYVGYKEPPYKKVKKVDINNIINNKIESF